MKAELHENFQVWSSKNKTTKAIFKTLSLSIKKKKITFHYVGQMDPNKFDNIYVRFGC